MQHCTMKQVSEGRGSQHFKMTYTLGQRGHEVTGWENWTDGGEASPNAVS